MLIMVYLGIEYFGFDPHHQCPPWSRQLLKGNRFSIEHDWNFRDHQSVHLHACGKLLCFTLIDLETLETRL